MTNAYVDRRGNRDFVASGVGILLVAALLLVTARWYVHPPAQLRAAPMRSRITYAIQSADAAPAPIRFSLPSKIGFSRTVQPGDPKAPTTLGPRAADIRFLPRPPAGAPAFPAANGAGAPAFSPWREEAPVFQPVAGGERLWSMLAETLNGTRVALPESFQDAAAWPAEGSWTALLRLEAGEDGRVRHVFVMPPAPAPELAARIETLMRKAKLEGGLSGRVRISRVERPAALGEGATR